MIFWQQYCLQNWFFAQIGYLSYVFGHFLGLETGNLSKASWTEYWEILWFCGTAKYWNRSLVERLKECEKGVFTAGHLRNPFQGKYPLDIATARRYWLQIYIKYTSPWSLEILINLTSSTMKWKIMYITCPALYISNTRTIVTSKSLRSCKLFVATDFSVVYNSFCIDEQIIKRQKGFDPPSPDHICPWK